MIVALTNVCAMPSFVVYERHKDRNVIAFAVLCHQEPKIADTNHPNGAGSKILNSYGALRTFMQNNPLDEEQFSFIDGC